MQPGILPDVPPTGLTAGFGDAFGDTFASCADRGGVRASGTGVGDAGASAPVDAETLGDAAADGAPYGSTAARSSADCAKSEPRGPCLPLIRFEGVSLFTVMPLSCTCAGQCCLSL
eukprot:9257816-Pyramimonas_sp.AAC.2